MELLQITAQYSNAVLVAILPHVSDFAHKLNLPIPTPVTPAQVRYFKCDPRKDHVGGMLMLTNRFQFTFLNGRVCVYRSPSSYFSLQDIDMPAEFYGPVKVSKKEAVRIAHEAIKKLGYTDKAVHADTDPKITPPVQIGTNYVPRYRIRWLDPAWRGARTPGSPIPAILDIEVNAGNRRVEMLSMTSRETQAPNPRVGVQPPPVQGQPKGPHLMQAGHASWASKEYASAMLTNVLPMISDFIAKAGLTVKTPVTTNDVDPSRYTCVIDQGNPVIQLYLKNGDRFNYTHGHVTAFYAHDAFFKFPEVGRVDEFIGKINVSTNEAIAVSKDALKRLGYNSKLDMAFGPPLYIPMDRFIRYFIRYSRTDDNAPVSNFEIDLGDKSIKAIYLDDPVLWRDPPKIDVPMLPITNAPPAKKSESPALPPPPSLPPTLIK